MTAKVSEGLSVEDLHRSQSFYRLIRRLQLIPLATPIPVEAAEATAQAPYNRLTSTGYIAGQGFLQTPWRSATALL